LKSLWLIGYHQLAIDVWHPTIQTSQENIEVSMVVDYS